MHNWLFILAPWPLKSEAVLEDLDKVIQIRIDFLRDDAGSMSLDMENTLRI